MGSTLLQLNVLSGHEEEIGKMSEGGNKGTNGALTMHHPCHESIAGTAYSWLFPIHNYLLAPKAPLFENNENI